MSTFSLTDVPVDLLKGIVEFISHPSDYFALRLVNTYFTSALKSVYVFKNINHVKNTFSPSLRICSQVNNISITSRLDVYSVYEMMDYAVPGAIVLGLLQKCDYFKEIIWRLNTRHYLEILMATFYCDYELNYIVLNCRDAFFIRSATRMLVALALDVAEDRVCLNMLIKYGTLYGDEDFHRSILTTALNRRLYGSLEWIVESPKVKLNQSFNGSYPIQIAVESGDPRLVSILLQAGATTKCRYRHGHLPLLHLACLQKGVEMLQMLLGNKTDLNVKDFTGRTARQLLQNILRKMAKRNITDHSEYHMKLDSLNRHSSGNIALH